MGKAGWVMYQIKRKGDNFFGLDSYSKNFYEYFVHFTPFVFTQKYPSFPTTDLSDALLCLIDAHFSQWLLCESIAIETKFNDRMAKTDEQAIDR